MMIFRYFDTNTDKRFDQGRDRDTLRWVRDWSEPDERGAHSTLGHSHFLTQGYIVFGSSGDNTDCSVRSLHLPNVIGEKAETGVNEEVNVPYFFFSFSPVNPFLGKILEILHSFLMSFNSSLPSASGQA